jgi:hypothetical protein
MTTDSPMDIEQAIHIANLWRAGKLIGYGEDGEELVRNALLAEIERLREAAKPSALLARERRKIEEAINEAQTRGGMRVGMPMAHIDANLLRRMLALIDSTTCTCWERECVCSPDSGSE